MFVKAISFTALNSQDFVIWDLFTNKEVISRHLVGHKCHITSLERWQILILEKKDLYRIHTNKNSATFINVFIYTDKWLSLIF